MLLRAAVTEVDTSLEHLAVACARPVLADTADAVLAPVVEGLARLTNQLAAAETAVFGEWATRGLYGLDGSRSAAARFCRDTGCSIASARRLVTRATRLRALPLVTGAFTTGDLSVDKVDQLCLAAAHGRHRLFAEAEAELVEHAVRLDFDQVQRLLQYWMDAADNQIGNDDRAAGQFRDRHLHASKTYRGTVVVNALLDPINGEIVLTELTRIEQQLWDDDWAEARHRLGPDATKNDLVRTCPQRRADALRLMAQRSRNLDYDTDSDGDGEPDGATDTDGAEPGNETDGAEPGNETDGATDTDGQSDTGDQPGVTTSGRAKARRRGRRAPVSVVIHVGEDTMARLCELADGTVLTPEHLLPWLTDADYERLVWGPDHTIKDLGRTSRFFTGKLRDAIKHRDRHCTYPGCDVPAHQCDIDHIVEWTNGGQTNQANARLRCPTHNRQRPGRTTPPNHGP